MKVVILFLFLIAFFDTSNAQYFPCLDNGALVIDDANVLKADELKSLNQRLNNLNNELNLRLNIIIVDSLSGLDTETYLKKMNAACNLLNNPHSREMLIFASISNKIIRIEGTKILLESFTASAAYDILDNTLNPYFIKKEYFKGLDSTVDQVELYAREWKEKRDKWYNIIGYDPLGLFIIYLMTLIFNVVVYVKFQTKPFKEYILNQLLWHFLGTLNIFLYTILIFRVMGDGIYPIIFNILIVLLQINLFIQSFRIFNFKSFFKTWSLVFAASCFLASFLMSFLGFTKVNDFQSFMSIIYYGFISCFVIISVISLKRS